MSCFTVVDPQQLGIHFSLPSHECSSSDHKTVEVEDGQTEVAKNIGHGSFRQCDPATVADNTENGQTIHCSVLSFCRFNALTGD